MSFYRLCATKCCHLNKINGINARNGSKICESKQLMRTQIATIIGVERKDPEIDLNKPKPWPYKTKKFTWFHFWFSLDCPTNERMDSNSKIIVIEGNKASGKEVVAKELAKEFGMLYMPEPDLNDYYVNHKGFDYRTLNKYVAPILQAVDEKMFYEQPLHKGVLWMKMYFYARRHLQYIDALGHLYSTGQGVVLERSPYSDFVFTEAMYKCGYYPDDARDYYYRNRHASIYELQRPHLIVYLDVPVEECLKRIKKRNIPHEVNSEVLRPEYLQEIENQYKNKYLPEASKASEVLIYDWTNYGDIEDVVEDIERLEMDEWDPHLQKFEDWNLWDQQFWEYNRIKFTKNKLDVYSTAASEVPIYDVDSLCIDTDDMVHREKIYNNLVPNYNILPSFDPDLHPFWKIMLRLRTNYREETEFAMRSPFY